MKLWYEQPANSWTEALPVGNGRLGAMIYGRTNQEIISLNEDTLWSGYPKDVNPKDGEVHFQQALQLAKDRKYHEAQELIERQLTSDWSQSYMPLGDLLLSFQDSGETSGYTRSLDLDTAVAGVEYRVDGVGHTRQIFASAPDNVIVIQLLCDRPKGLSFEIEFQCPLKSEVSVKDRFLVVKGEAPSHVEPNYVTDCENPVLYSEKDEERGMLFAAVVKVMPYGGHMKSTGSKMIIEGADRAVIYVNAHTSFAGFDVLPYLNGKEYEKPCFEEIEAACSKSYQKMLLNHTADYKQYYDRIYLDLGETLNASLPTDKRLYHFKDEQNDPALYTLLFQYGRYLLIASSRKGTQAANLQGIWNRELRPPWSSNYTVNINTQMNYWPVFSCGLGELQSPLVDLIKELSVTGRVTADQVYGAKGFTSHHNVDIWRLSSPVGKHQKGSAVYAFWNMSAAWLCRHLFDQYEYTLDKGFLRETAYPLMKSAAEFLLDIMTTDKEGCQIISPSTSPENTFLYEGKSCSVAATTTMTMTITKELFKNCVKSAEILKCDESFRNLLKNNLKRLYPYKKGSKGQLLEWYEEYEEEDYTHRHLSHLYGLYPANEITVEQTPELAAACRNSLKRRGDDGTGWSLGWKINLWARLFDGDHALKLINRQLRVVESKGIQYHQGGGTYINMLDAHPPFQIDGNFGAASGIAEMLLQSRGDKVFILPALPSAWQKGCVKGLRAKRLIKVDIHWDLHQVTAELLSGIDQNIRVAIKDTDTSPISLKAGIPMVLTRKA